MDHAYLGACRVRSASCAVVEDCSSAVLREEVIFMSCANPDCRRGGCTTGPKPSEGSGPKR